MYKYCADQNELLAFIKFLGEAPTLRDYLGNYIGPMLGPLQVARVSMEAKEAFHEYPVMVSAVHEESLDRGGKGVFAELQVISIPRVKKAHHSLIYPCSCNASDYEGHGEMIVDHDEGTKVQCARCIDLRKHLDHRVRPELPTYRELVDKLKEETREH